MPARTRVAVQVGAATVRVAVAGPRAVPQLAAPQLVAQVPRDRFAGLAAVVAAYAGPTPAELVLVHPGGADPATVAADVAAAAPLAAVVRAVPAPEAAATGTDAVAVLDAGHSGIEVTVLGPRGGHASHPGGGALLDAELAVACLVSRAGNPQHDSTAQAAPRGVAALAKTPGMSCGRRLARSHLDPPTHAPDFRRRTPDDPVTAVRERLSLLPAAGPLTAAQIAPMLTEVLSGPVAALRAELDRAGVDGPVLLVGGLARTPLLAELVDAAGVRAARVPERPEAAAVLGALRGPPAAGPVAAPDAPAWLPAPAGRTAPALRRIGTVSAAVVAVVALLAAGQLLPGPTAPVTDAGIVQYGYRAALPEGWAHTGGRPERRRTLLTPVRSPQGSDLVAIEASPLGYDPEAEPERAARELRAVYDEGVAGGAVLSDYAPATSFAGRSVTAYRQRQHGDGLVVDWYVLFERDTQLSVGCRHTPAGAAAVARACATVVATLHRTHGEPP